VKVTINGKDYIFDEYKFDNPEDKSIAWLLSYLKLKSIKVVVERNGTIIEDSDYSIEKIHEGDTLEIVQFVGGG
jgi:thiamine biosynthesis protein ThiS